MEKCLFLSHPTSVVSISLSVWFLTISLALTLLNVLCLISVISFCFIPGLFQNPQPQTLPARCHHRAAMWRHLKPPCHPARGQRRKRHKEMETWRLFQGWNRKKRRLDVFSTAPSARWPSTLPRSCRPTTVVRKCTHRSSRA